MLRGFASGSKAFYFHPKRGKEIWLQVCSQDVEGEVAAKFELKKSGNGQFYFSLRAANGEPKEAI